MGIDSRAWRGLASGNPLAADARLLDLVAAGRGGTGKAAEGVSLRRGRITTRGLLQRMAVVEACRWSSNHTRPVSWLGPETSGTHPRTKGTRCFAGGRRRRVPFTPKGLLAPRALR